MKFSYADRIKKPTDILKQPFQDVCRFIGRGVFHLVRRALPPPCAKKQIARLLLVRRNRLGDAICLLPAIQALKEADPGIHVGVLANPYNAPVFSMSPAIDKVHVLPERYCGNRWLLRWHPEMQAIRGEEYDLAVSATLTPSSHAARLCGYSGAIHSAGITSTRGSVYDLLFDCPVSPEQISHVHQVEKIADLLRASGMNLGQTLPAARLVLEHAPARRKDLVCLCPEVHRPESEWPVSSYAALVAELRRRWPSVRIQLMLQGDGPYVALAGLEGVEQVRNPVFHDFAAKLAEAALVVCSEGGVSHLAPALGTPAVVLSGVAIRQTWAPWSDHAVLLESTGDAGKIGVEEVLAAIESLAGDGFRQ